MLIMYTDNQDYNIVIVTGGGKMKTVTRDCGHTVEIEDAIEAIFDQQAVGLPACDTCKTVRSNYEAVYHAMAGNKVALQGLVEHGVVPANPTLGDLERAGTGLFALLDVQYRAAEHAELVSA